MTQNVTAISEDALEEYVICCFSKCSQALLFWRTQTDARTAMEKSFKCCLSVADVNPHHVLAMWQTWEMIVQPEYLLK